MMDSNIISFDLLGKLANITDKYKNQMDSEVRRVDDYVNSAIAEAEQNREIVQQYLITAKTELEQEQYELKCLQSQMNSANDDDKDSYRNMIAAQQCRVEEVQAKVWKIENIIRDVNQAATTIKSAGHRAIQVKNKFLTDMSEATSDAVERLLRLQQDMQEATAVLHRMFRI